VSFVGAAVAALLTLLGATPPLHGAGRGAAPACLPRWPARVAVSGTLRREVHPGPPGYGETPSEDERDTVVVLVPDRALTACADSADAARGVRPRSLRRIQLVHVPRSTLAAVGSHVTVYGGLDEATWGSHFTPFVIFTDSIPAIQHERPPARSASRA
jgi:hypothetical protein